MEEEGDGHVSCLELVSVFLDLTFPHRMINMRIIDLKIANPSYQGYHVNEHFKGTRPLPHEVYNQITKIRHKMNAQTMKINLCSIFHSLIIIYILKETYYGTQCS